MAFRAYGPGLKVPVCVALGVIGVRVRTVRAFRALTL